MTSIEAYAPLHGAPAHDDEIGCTGLPHKKLMMWAFLGSDCMFFGSLIATYVIYHGRSNVPPYPSEVFNIPLTSFSSFVLLMSSLFMVLTLAAIQKDDLGRFRLWCASTAFGGLVFLGCQVYEFSTFYLKDHLTLTGNLFGSTFYVLTGTHGTHVAIGVLWLVSLLAYSWKGGFSSANALDVEVAGLYWHFVDIVWVVIFTVVYLLEYILPAHVGG